ncbi:MAG: hypothetical protein ACKKL5_01535 [Candidatus Komeilibacteria bacterium]
MPKLTKDDKKIDLTGGKKNKKQDKAAIKKITKDAALAAVKVKLSPANKDNNYLPASYKKILALIIIGVIILGIFIFHYSFAAAKIFILPQYSEHPISFSTQIVSPDYPNIDQSQDALIGRKLSTTINKTATYSVSKQTENSDKAGGNITIINNYSKDQPLIATTRLLTNDNKLFRLTETIVVPAGGQITAPVQADKVGDEYLIGPTHFTMPGLWEGLQDKIYAQSDQSMTYQTLEYYNLSEADQKQAYADLKQQIIEEALAEFKTKKTDNEFINPDALITKEVRHSYSQPIGANVPEFDLELEMLITTITYDEQKLLDKIASDIDILSEQNNGLIKFSNNDITITISEATGDNPNIIGNIQGKYTIQLANPDIDIEQIKGKDKATALKYLTQLSGVANASIQLQPFWLKNIPTLDNHIHIILNKD